VTGVSWLMTNRSGRRAPFGAIVVSLVATLGCKGTGGGGGGSGSGSGSARGSAEQTLHDAMAILCGRGELPPDVSAMNPADRTTALSHWLDRVITNPDGRTVIAAVGDTRDRPTQIRRAAADAGIDDCEPLALFGARTIGGANVPDLAAAAPGTDELDQDLLVVVASPDAIVVDGTAVIPIRKGELDPAEAPKLGVFLAATADVARTKARTPLTVAIVALDRSLPVGVLATIAEALGHAGVARIELAVGIGAGENRMVPVLLAAPAAPGRSLGMTVTVGPTDLVVASRSGEEGTAARPKLRIPLDPAPALREALQAGLREIVDRRWHGQARASADDRIVVTADHAVTAQALAEILGAVRAGPDGTPLFPEVVLGLTLDDAPAVR